MDWMALAPLSAGSITPTQPIRIELMVEAGSSEIHQGADKRTSRRKNCPYLRITGEQPLIQGWFLTRACARRTYDSLHVLAVVEVSERADESAPPHAPTRSAKAAMSTRRLIIDTG